MSHTGKCEAAEGYSCKCPCGGALHGAVLVRGISSTDPSVQDVARAWSEPQRWTRVSAENKNSTVGDSSKARRAAMTGLISELVLALIEQVREEGEIDAIGILAEQVSEEVGEELESYLSGGGPDRKRINHVWCVVLATICRLYDQGFSIFEEAVASGVDAVLHELQQDASTSRTDDTQAQDIYAYKLRVKAAFDLTAFPFLKPLIKKAIGSLISAVKAIGEEAVMKHLRLICVIMCPDPDRHPDVVKYCLWPLVSGPFKEMLQEAIATETRTWLRNAYVVVPTR